MYKIILPIRIDGIRYGISFVVDNNIGGAIGYTDNTYVANRMIEKGFTVSTIESNGENMALSELNKKMARNKALQSSIMEFSNETKNESLSDEQNKNLTKEKSKMVKKRKTGRKPKE